MDLPYPIKKKRKLLILQHFEMSFDSDTTYTCQLVARVGIVTVGDAQGKHGRKTVPGFSAKEPSLIEFKPSDGLEHLLSIVMVAFRRHNVLDKFIWKDKRVFLKPSSAAPQTSYIVLSDNNLDALMTNRFQAFKKSSKPSENMFEFVVYVESKERALPGIHRATRSRLEVSAPLVQVVY